VETPQLNLRTEFRLDFNRFEKERRWRQLPGQDNRENYSARFSCAHVFTQPSSLYTLAGAVDAGKTGTGRLFLMGIVHTWRKVD
jgi:hypothetical protein